MSETRTYPLRLPKSLKDAVERISRQEGTSINQFVATASRSGRRGPISNGSIA